MAAWKARAQMKWSKQCELDEGMSQAVTTSPQASRDHDDKRTYKPQVARMIQTKEESHGRCDPIDRISH
jgi:hypothetical protein